MSDDYATREEIRNADEFYFMVDSDPWGKEFIGVEDMIGVVEYIHVDEEDWATTDNVYARVGKKVVQVNPFHVQNEIDNYVENYWTED